MMRERKDFISWVYDPSVNRKRADIIIDMLHFIRSGLRDLGGPAKDNVHFFEFETWVKAALFERLASPMDRAIPRRMMVDAGLTLEMVAASINETNSWANHGSPMAAFRCGTITNDLQERVNSFWHPEINEETPTVETAFEVAYSNVARAGTRLVLMHVLVDLLKLSSPPPVWTKIREELWMRKTGFMNDLLMFGGLAGGELHKTALRLVAKQSCYNADGDSGVKFGLMHYLSCDGYSPGRWMTATEDSLETSIRRSYEAL